MVSGEHDCKQRYHALLNVLATCLQRWLFLGMVTALKCVSGPYCIHQSGSDFEDELNPSMEVFWASVGSNVSKVASRCDRKNPECEPGAHD